MINNGRNITTREPLGRMEARFLVKVAVKPTFSIEEARRLFRDELKHLPPQFFDRLERKGWISRIKRGRFAVIPLSSGEARTPQLHEFLIAMEMVSPAAIAYWSALNHHGMTEQIPRTVFVATNHHVQLNTKEALGVTFKIISVRPPKFFGIIKDWIDEQPFSITDKEKTIIDGLDLPKYVGGVGEIAKALKQAWEELDEAKLREYAVKVGNSAVAKRLGCLMEALNLGNPEALRKVVSLAPGFSALDPTLPKKGKHDRRWGLLINVEVGE
jgi:predicted transcriptional regulator of viral defense system